MSVAAIGALIIGEAEKAGDRARTGIKALSSPYLRWCQRLLSYWTRKDNSVRY